MKTIQLTKGYVTTISDQDFARVNAFKWHAQERKRKDGTLVNVYAKRTVYLPDGSHINELLHRFIVNATDPLVEVDHKDRVGLHNQRRNLRVCDKPNNQHNAGLRRDNTSGFKGVTWDKTHERWMAQLRMGGRKLYTGYFLTAEDAARGYDAAARKYFGEFARLNFPPKAA